GLVTLTLDTFWVEVFKADDPSPAWSWKKVGSASLEKITLPKYTRADLGFDGEISFDVAIIAAFQKARAAHFECPAVLIDLKTFGFKSIDHNNLVNSEFKDMRDYMWKRCQLPQRAGRKDDGSCNQPLGFDQHPGNGICTHGIDTAILTQQLRNSQFLIICFFQDSPFYESQLV
ncbi:unnamed protein product, partial [Allacma fusca]